MVETDHSVQIAGGTAVPQEGHKKSVAKDADVPDLSHVFGVGADEGQEAHGNQPHALLEHLVAGFAHHANPKKYPHPGAYKGPPPVMPDDWETPEDTTEQKNEAQSEAISNISNKSAPVIPSAPKTPAGPRLPSAPTYNPSQAPGNTVPS